MAAPMEGHDAKKLEKKIPKSKRKLKNKGTDRDSNNQESQKKRLKWCNYSVAEFKVEVKDPNLTFQGKHVRNVCDRQLNYNTIPKLVVYQKGDLVKQPMKSRDVLLKNVPGVGWVL